MFQDDGVFKKNGHISRVGTAQERSHIYCRWWSRAFRDGTNVVVLCEEYEMAGHKGGML